MTPISLDDDSYEWTHSRWEIDLLEVILRHQFGDSSVAAEALVGTGIVFVALRGPDWLLEPPPELLARFEDTPSVQPLSGPGIATPGPTEDKEREAHSTVLVFDYLKPIDDSSIEVTTFQLDTDDSENTYLVEQRDGVWVVVRASAL